MDKGEPIQPEPNQLNYQSALSQMLDEEEALNEQWIQQQERKGAARSEVIWPLSSDIEFSVPGKEPAHIANEMYASWRGAKEKKDEGYHMDPQLAQRLGYTEDDEEMSFD